MMKIDNDYSREYEEEMARYTVDRQQYVADDLNDNEDGDDSNDSTEQ